MKWIILDFGSHQINAFRLELENHLIHIEDSLFIPAEEDFYEGLGFPTEKAWQAAVKGIGECGWMENGPIAVSSALPSLYLETRYLRFPFRSERKIEKVLPMELDGLLPFDLSELLVRHQVLKGPGVPSDKAALVLIMAYQRSRIQAYENQLQHFQVSVPPVSTQNFHLASLRQGIMDCPIAGILEIGHQKSDWLLFQPQGQVLATRSISWGLKNMASAVQQDASCTFEEARDKLFQTDLITADQKSLQTSIEGFQSQVRQSLKAASQAGLDLPAELPIFLLGASSTIPGLLESLEKPLKREFGVQLSFYPWENLNTQIRGLEGFENPLAVLAPLGQALSQMRAHRNRVPNFSESNFQFQQNLKRIQSGSVVVLKRAAILFAVPFLYLVLSLILQSQEQSRLQQQLAENLERSGVEISTEQPIPEIRRQLETQLRENRRRAELVETDQNSPLLILRDISQIIPRHLRIDVREFRVSSDEIYIQGITDGDESREEIASNMRKVFPELETAQLENCEIYEGCRRFEIQIPRG